MEKTVVWVKKSSNTNDVRDLIIHHTSLEKIVEFGKETILVDSQLDQHIISSSTMWEGRIVLFLNNTNMSWISH